MIHSKPFDPDLSLDLVLHQPVRSLLSSDQAMHHNPYPAYWISYFIRYSSISPYLLPNDLLLLL